MTNKEHLNEKVAHTEKILKLIKVLNEADKHNELMSAVLILNNFTQDIHYLGSEIIKHKDVGVRFDKDLVQNFTQGELSYELQQMRQFQKAFGKTDWQLPKE